MNKTFKIKSERAQHANQLINTIANHGRKFFLNQKNNKTAEMYVTPNGSIWFVDDYTGKAIYTQYDGRWRGFTHGSTLKQLVEKMRDYIRTGQQIDIRYIAPNRGAMDGGYDMWGYGKDACTALRADIYGLPIICGGAQ